MIRKKIKKTLATALVLGLSLNTFMNINVFSSFANSSLYAGGTGTAEDPYLISTPEHLNQLRLDLTTASSNYYKLINDIDLSGFDTDDDSTNGNWTPIVNFKGVLDGAGFSINNVTVNLPEKNKVAFINSTLASSVIKNLNLKNADIKGWYEVAGLAYYNNGRIVNSSVQGNVTAINRNNGTTVNNYSTAGFVSINSLTGYIYNSNSDVYVFSPKEAGGFVCNNQGTILNAYSKGTVSGTERSGGFISQNNGHIKNAISYSNVISELTSGAFAYRVYSPIENSYWNTELSGKTNAYVPEAYALADLVGLTTTQMQGENAKTNMPSLDFSNTWSTVENDFPVITGEYIFKETGDEPYSSGTGTETDPYLISNAKQLSYLANQVNVNGFDTTGKYYKLSNDIDFSNYDTDFNDLNGNWIPIGYNNTKIFKGTFDGNNKVIKNLSIRNKYMFVGLFGAIQSATIKNVGLVNLDIKTESSNSQAELYKDGNYYYYFVGGLVGTTLSTPSDNYNNIIENSFVKGNIDATIKMSGMGYYLSVGGVIGKGEAVRIENSYSQGNIIANSKSTSTPYITSGGIVGKAIGSNLTDAINNNGVLINNVYSTMNMKNYFDGTLNNNGNSGGLIGNIELNGKVQNSYWDKETTGLQRGALVGGNSTFSDIFGLTTTEMQGENAKTNMQLLDFNNTWSTVNNDYPVLKAQVKAPALTPSIDKLEGNLIELIDNNSEKGTLYYRINRSGNWILYTSPFQVEYDADGNFYLEVKSINASGVESDITVITGNEFEQMDVSKDVAINVNVANSLEVKLSTNIINFSDYNGTQDFEENDFIITVSSGLAYDIDTILTKELTDKSNSENKIPTNLLGVKLSSDADYKFFENQGDEKNLISNSPNGEDIQHNVSFKLKGNSSVIPSNYQGIITFDVTQR